MKLVSWNIQWARGIDGIVDDARRLADFDVLCLQEVAANFSALPGSRGEDQFEVFAGLLPGFTAVSAAGVDVAAPDGCRRRFGNMLLSRWPVLRVLRHQLPWPVDAGVTSMPRVMLEATLDTPLGTMVVMTTHLEYHSALQRRSQIEAIRNRHAENCLRALGSRVHGNAGSPYQAVPPTTRTLLTGDFNFLPEDALHARLQQPFDVGVPRLVDTWQHLHGTQPHPHSVALHDREYFPQPCTTDFIFASADLLPHVRRFEVDGSTLSSDHQPLLLELS
jgi:endonuclease/exonuclease/phosphatase family metal-dependent hydrolase